MNLNITERGFLAPGHFADVVVFDPDEVTDHATFEQPHQLASGVLHVWVNGEQVLADGEHTGSKPGRVVRGPGWTRSLTEDLRTPSRVAAATFLELPHPD